MKVKDLIEKLKEYNPEAKISVVVHNQIEQFSIAYGKSEGVAKEKCEEVNFYVDRLCGSERKT